MHCILFDVLLQIAAYLKEKLDIAKIELKNGLGKSNDFLNCLVPELERAKQIPCPRQIFS